MVSRASARRRRALGALLVWLLALLVAPRTVASPRVVAPPIAAPGRAPARSLPAPVVGAPPRSPKDKPALRERAAPAPAPRPHVRDWSTAPAVVEHIPAGEVFAVSDLHGHYDLGVKLLRGNGLIDGDPAHPEAMRWTGGNATLVVVGDFVNKGPDSVKLLDVLRAVQKSATKSGGKVIVTLGNHEADFLHRPTSKRAMRDGADGRYGVGHDLALRGLSPEEVALGLDEGGRGAWLRELPFAAKVGDSFFVHAGDTGGQSREELELHIHDHVEGGGFGHDAIQGEDASLIGADDWQRTAQTAAANAGRLGVKRIIMGHAPHALSAHGDIGRTQDGALVKIDTGMGNDEAPALLLKIGKGGRLTRLDDQGRPGELVSFP
jgi:hypothetical protein